MVTITGTGFRYEEFKPEIGSRLLVDREYHDAVPFRQQDEDYDMLTVPGMER